MAGGTMSVRLAFGSLAVVLALGGCAGRSWHSWQFWKASSPETPATRVAAAEDGAPAAPASPVVPTAHPARASETPATTAPSASDFVEMPTLPDVRFRPGRVTVGKADAGSLDALARWLEGNPGSQVRIEGHTDDLGSAIENMAIGEKRAASAMKYLVAKGLDPDRISIVSYGSDRPVCVEKTKTCRARNRRVHFLVRQP